MDENGSGFYLNFPMIGMSIFRMESGFLHIDIFIEGKNKRYFENLERKIELKEADTFEKLLYWVFNMVEVIHRVDFASKYYFHTLTPKNPSIRVAVVHHNTMYSFAHSQTKL